MSTHTPHNFLLHLTARAPHLARRLDGVCGFGMQGDLLFVRVAENRWSDQELNRRLDELEATARSFFGATLRLEIVRAPAAPEALPPGAGPVLGPVLSGLSVGPPGCRQYARDTRSK